MSEQRSALFRRWTGAVLLFLAGIAGAVAAVGQVAQFLREQQWLDLAVGFLVVVVVAATVAGGALVVARNRSGATGPVLGVSERVVLGVVATFSVMLVAGAIFLALWIVDRPVQPAAASSHETTSPPAPAPPAAAVPSWTEPFAGGGLDPDHWNAPSSPGMIRVVDGRLEFRVTPEGTPEDWTTAGLVPRLPGGAIREVSLTATVTQVTPSDGGVDLIVRQDSGRESRIRMGPSPAGPGAEPWICLRLPCGSHYQEFDHPPPPATFVQGRPESVSIVHDGTQLRLHAAGVVYDVPADSSPIVSVEFMLEAGQREEWLVTIDDLQVVPA